VPVTHGAISWWMWVISGVRSVGMVSADAGCLAASAVPVLATIDSA
jgi:hypothetical protein